MSGSAYSAAHSALLLCVTQVSEEGRALWHKEIADKVSCHQSLRILIAMPRQLSFLSRLSRRPVLSQVQRKLEHKSKKLDWADRLEAAAQAGVSTVQYH